MLTFDKAKAKLLQSVMVTQQIEKIPLALSVGKVLAEDVISPNNVPPQNNSAMDGFAFSYADFLLSNKLPVSQKIFAGMTPLPLQKNTAVRLFTGSVIPIHADTVVLQEDCFFTEEEVIINESPKLGQHIRYQGEDVMFGNLLLLKGISLEPKHIGLLASVGIQEVLVFQSLRLGLLATGDELVEPGQALKVGQIYNSNLYLLRAECEKLGFSVNAQFVRDDLQAITDTLREMCLSNDVILTIGGVSVGDADLVKQAIASLGELNLWKVSMKPGKPLSYGHILSKPIIGLPGNPVSAFATFHLFARPYLQAMQGAQDSQGLANNYSQFPIFLEKPLNPSREEFVRVQLKAIDDTFILLPYPKQGSGVFSSVVWATGFARISQDKITASGDKVSYIPFM